MNEVTRILEAIANGNQQASDQLLPIVYTDLRKLAGHLMVQEAPGQTLQPTALVHEAFVRLVGSDSDQKWDHRGHFFMAAATAMRRILIENVRRKQTLKRGGHMVSVEVELGGLAEPQAEEALLDLDDALQKLGKKHERKTRIVELRFFSGLTMDQIAKTLGISLATVERDWAFARAWLRRELSGGDGSSDSESAKENQ